nr:PREDICTED: E3 ubiquitin-protein ligase MARCH11-like [Notothenia coriiceps]
MSTEEGEARGGEEVKGGETLPHSHTWGEGEPHGGGERRLNPGEEKEEEPGEEEEARSCRDACEGNNGGHFSREEEEEEVGVLGGKSCKEQTMHSNSSSETCIPTPSCRICFQGAEQGALLNPCRCDGSVRYTHQTCLLKWISERGCWTCELCCYRFSVIAINTKNPWQVCAGIGACRARHPPITIFGAGQEMSSQGHQGNHTAHLHKTQSNRVNRGGGGRNELSEHFLRNGRNELSEHFLRNGRNVPLN